MSKKDGGAGKAARIAQADEAQRQATIRQGTEAVNGTFKQFDDPYFQKQRDNYTAFALPQLEDQYGKAQKDLTYALARDGNLNSSAQAAKLGELQKAYETQRTSIADQGQTYANQARTSVEDARANLLATLNATGDATGAANSAVARSAALAAPQGYSPIGDAFGAITGALAQQASLERSAALGGAIKPTYNTGLFGSNAGAVRVN